MKVKIGPYPVNKNKSKKRSIKVEIDQFDLWSLDHTLATIIAPCLKKFLESPKGYPGNIKSNKQWNDLIEKMHWSFQQIANDEPDHPKRKSNPLEAGFDNYELEYKKYHKKIDEGLKLFAKYFQHLWI